MPGYSRIKEISNLGQEGVEKLCHILHRKLCRRQSDRLLLYPPKRKWKKLLLPKPNRYSTNLVSYLQHREIDTEIIEFCLKTAQIYESVYYHNAVFVGKDKEGIPRYAALRGMGTDFIGSPGRTGESHSHLGEKYSPNPKFYSPK